MYISWIGSGAAEAVPIQYYKKYRAPARMAAVRTVGLAVHMAAAHTVGLAVRMAAARTVDLAVHMAAVHTVDLAVRTAAARTVDLTVRTAAARMTVVHMVDSAVRMAAAHMAVVHTVDLAVPAPPVPTPPAAGSPDAVPAPLAADLTLPPTAQPDCCNFHHDSYPSFPPFRSAASCSASRTLPRKFLFFLSLSSNDIRKCCKLLKRQGLPTHSQRHSKLRDTLLNDFLGKLELRKIMETIDQRFSALIK